MGKVGKCESQNETEREKKKIKKIKIIKNKKTFVYPHAQVG